MRKMKDSGIEWIGEIPQDWEVRKLKSIGHIQGRIGFKGYTVSDIVDEDSQGRAIVLGGTNIMREGYISYNKITYLSENKYFESPEIMLYGDEILITKVGAGTGDNAIYKHIDERVTINPNVMIYKTYNKENAPFINYYLLSAVIKNDIFLESNKSGAQPAINQEYVKNIKIIFPPLIEQAKIVNYLDQKCTKIDNTIEKQKQVIEKLKAYKQSIITEAVTKGLNPDVPMKDSGIAWIGEIPEHWKVSTLKNLGEAIIGLTYSPDEVKDFGILVLRSSNIQKGKITLNDNVYVDSNKDIKDKLKVRKGDILICSRNGSKTLIGKNAVIDEEYEGCSFGAFMTVFRSKYNKFIYYVLNSTIFSFHIGSFLTSTINQLTTGNLNSIKIGFPDTTEQMAIANYLDQKCTQIDTAISKKEALIEKLTEYKKSLIYECVTGKIEVQGE